METLPRAHNRGNECTNVTLRCVRVTIIALYNTHYIFRMCDCSLSHAACTAHAPYYAVTCRLPCCIIFFHRFHGTIFGNQGIERKLCVSICSTTFSETFPNPRRIQRDIINFYKSSCNLKCTYVFPQSCCHSCQILIKVNFSRYNFEKYSYTRFHENLSSGSRVVPCGRTDGQCDRRTDRRTDRHTGG